MYANRGNGVNFYLFSYFVVPACVIYEDSGWKFAEIMITERTFIMPFISRSLFYDKIKLNLA